VPAGRRPTASRPLPPPSSSRARDSGTLRTSCAAPAARRTGPAPRRT
jgi:hypothetical protein